MYLSTTLKKVVWRYPLICPNKQRYLTYLLMDQSKWQTTFSYLKCGPLNASLTPATVLSPVLIMIFFLNKKNWELKWASAVYSVPSSFRWSIEFWNIKEIIYHNNYTSNWCFVCVLIIYRKWTLFDIERYILHVYSGIYVLCFTNPEHTLLSLGSWTINMKLSVPFRLGNIPREL